MRINSVQYDQYGQGGSTRLPMIVIRLILGIWPEVLQPYCAVRESRTQSNHPGANAWCSRLTKMPLRLPSLSLEQCIKETSPVLYSMMIISNLGIYI